MDKSKPRNKAFNKFKQNGKSLSEKIQKLEQKKDQGKHKPQVKRVIQKQKNKNVFENLDKVDLSENLNMTRVIMKKR